MDNIADTSKHTLQNEELTNIEANVANGDIQNFLDLQATIDNNSSDEEQIFVEGIPFSNVLQQSYSKMDDSFQNYLDIFNQNTKRTENQKFLLKYIFFGIVLAVLVLLVIFPYILMIKFSSLITDTTIISLVFSSLAETVSAIIVLPKIIAKYLFNKDEEANKINIIKGMQKYNINKKDDIKNE